MRSRKQWRPVCAAKHTKPSSTNLAAWPGRAQPARGERRAQIQNNKSWVMSHNTHPRCAMLKFSWDRPCMQTPGVRHLQELVQAARAELRERVRAQRPAPQRTQQGSAALPGRALAHHPMP